MSGSNALEWCDIAVIASPPQFHTSNLKSAIFAGKPCLVEKPVSNSDVGLEESRPWLKNVILSCLSVKFATIQPWIMERHVLTMASLVTFQLCINWSILFTKWRPNRNFKDNYSRSSIRWGLFDWVQKLTLFYL